MPEYLEVYSTYLVLRKVMAKLVAEGADLTVQQMYADRTRKEANRLPKSSRAGQGLIDVIDGTFKGKWGNTGGQTSLFPTMWATNSKNPATAMPITALSLRGPESVKATNRAIILDFGPLHLSVRSVICSAC